MCVINNTYGFVFVHIPKCAGSAVTDALSMLNTAFDLEIGGTSYGEAFQRVFSNRYGIFKHSLAPEIRAQIGQERWNRYLSFAVVRNPYARVYSAFKYYHQYSERFKFIREYDSLDKFVLSEVFSSDAPERLLLQQYRWLVSGRQPEKTMVDRIIPIDDMGKELANLMRQLGVNPTKAARFEAIKRKNVSALVDVSPRISKRAVIAVQNLYKRDFELLNYDPNVIPTPLVLE